MTLEPDALADRIEREIRDGAFILLGPAEVALCGEALRFFAPWASKQPATIADHNAFVAEQQTKARYDALHPKLAEVLDSYGCLTGAAQLATKKPKTCSECYGTGKSSTAMYACNPPKPCPCSACGGTGTLNQADE